MLLSNIVCILHRQGRKFGIIYRIRHDKRTGRVGKELRLNEKTELRKRWMAREAGFTEDYITESNAGIARNLFTLPEFQNAGTVLFFYSIWREPDTHEMIRHALELGKTAALPRTYPKGVMEARRIQGLNDLIPSRFGIPEPPESAAAIEPDALDFIVVPSVVFDREGFRIGHGVGYYDRYLPLSRAFACGIARENMLARRVPREPHDFQVNALVTERRILRF